MSSERGFRGLFFALVLLAADPAWSFGQEESGILPHFSGDPPRIPSPSRPPKSPAFASKDTGAFAYRRLRRPEDMEPARFPRWEFSDSTPGATEYSKSGPLDLLIGFPEDLVGGALHSLDLLTHDEDDLSMSEESHRALLVRMAASTDVGPRDRPFDSLVGLWMEREVKYFGQWGESPMATIAVEEGLEDLDHVGFIHAQKKVFTHTLGRYYLGRYAAPLNDCIRRDVFDLSRWGAADYAVGPCIIAGYLYLRGWDRYFAMGDLDCRLHLSPVDRINRHLRRTDDYLVSAASLEFGVKGFPLKAIVSGGVLNGSPSMEFVGIGTTVAMFKKTIKLEMATPDTER